MSRVVAIVQARMGSTRLPGKSMEIIAGRPLIDLVLSRLARARRVDAVVLATSDRPADDVLAQRARALGLASHRGSETDVLARFAEASAKADADQVVRVCADNPFISPEEVDRAVERHLQGGADLTFNHRPLRGNGYPDGLGAEVLSATLLEDTARVATDASHREHVTKRVWDMSPPYRVETFAAPASIRGETIKLDIDTPNDLARMRRLAAALPERDPSTWTAEEIVGAYRATFGGGA